MVTPTCATQPTCMRGEGKPGRREGGRGRGVDGDLCVSSSEWSRRSWCSSHGTWLLLTWDGVVKQKLAISWVWDQFNGRWSSINVYGSWWIEKCILCHGLLHCFPVTRQHMFVLPCSHQSVVSRILSRDMYLERSDSHKASDMGWIWVNLCVMSCRIKHSEVIFVLLCWASN